MGSIGENKLVNGCHEQDTTDAITKGTTAKAVKVTIITSENNSDAGNSAIFFNKFLNNFA